MQKTRFGAVELTFVGLHKNCVQLLYTIANELYTILNVPGFDFPVILLELTPFLPCDKNKPDASASGLFLS